MEMGVSGGVANRSSPPAVWDVSVRSTGTPVEGTFSFVSEPRTATADASPTARLASCDLTVSATATAGVGTTSMARRPSSSSSSSPASTSSSSPRPSENEPRLETSMPIMRLCPRGRRMNPQRLPGLPTSLSSPIADAACGVASLIFCANCAASAHGKDSAPSPSFSPKRRTGPEKSLCAENR